MSRTIVVDNLKRIVDVSGFKPWFWTRQFGARLIHLRFRKFTNTILHSLEKYPCLGVRQVYYYRCSDWLGRLQRLAHYITGPLLPNARAEYCRAKASDLRAPQDRARGGRRFREVVHSHAQPMQRATYLDSCASSVF